jgi:hypothetical protein
VSDVIQLVREAGWIVPTLIATPTIWKKYGKPSILWCFNWLMNNSKLDERFTKHETDARMHPALIEEEVKPQ